MPRILAVGASGFVGAHVVRRLLAEGHVVCGFAPSPEPCLTEADTARIAFVRGDAAEPGALNDAIGSFRPAAVVGLAAHGAGGRGLMAAARSDTERARAVNVEGFRLLLEACRARGVARVLWASTGAVFGDPRLYPPDGAVDEDSPPAPETEYGATKRAAEELACAFRQEHGLAVTGVRLPLVFGPGLWYRGAAAQISALFEAAAHGGRAVLEMPPDPADIVYVKDTARAFSFLAGAPGALEAIYNLHAYAPTPRALAAELRMLAPELDVEVVETAAAHRFPVMRGERLRALGFEPAWSLHEACADYLDELRR